MHYRVASSKWRLRVPFASDRGLRLGSALIAQVVLLGIMASLGCGQSSTPSPGGSGSTPAPTPTAVSDPLPIPTSGVFWGATVNDGTLPCPGGCGGSLATMTDTFESSAVMNRKLALHMLYYVFDAAIAQPGSGWSLASDYNLTDDMNNGRVPIISWNCSANNSVGYVTMSDIAAGVYDANIAQMATSLKSIPSPVLLRFFWEMNSRANNHDGCLGYNGSNLATVESNYQQAFERIVAIFKATGATNVSFVWSPWAGFAQSKYYDAARPDGKNFFPTGSYVYQGTTYTHFVDWIGIDVYDPLGYSFAQVMTSTNSFMNVYSGLAYGTSIYDTYTNQQDYQGIPLLITETGVPQSSTDLTFQNSFIGTSATTGMETIPAMFPKIHAVVYFDKNDSKNTNNWLFSTKASSTGTSGQADYKLLGENPHFQCAFSKASPTTPCND